ncbi:hypothetical protein MJO28_008020 [Puccinia striiformis f. sp. tritici]|uniref:Alpha-type protein kinase domain-containing protein n=3 Tax=Puccinia striiformis f. sp. tritici TaxID=168172 RepID=A0A0L0VVX8_9BASI|nr:hypothetical protein MJO28_008020 [Puccinia striiformis f. sp. tritici]KNF03352.1 hypothetical protein PSTG_03295 [Puccinia striiformis f. sp. tritici PST-78]
MRSEISKSPRRVGMTYQEKCVKLQIDRHTVVIEGLIDDPKQIYFFKKALKGLYIKYSSNMDLKLNKHRDGVDLEVAQSMDGFTHWSYVHTDGESLICDLQGVGPTLTDPQIISPDPNLWADGIEHFLQNDECNPVCQAFGYKHPNDPNAIPNTNCPNPIPDNRGKAKRPRPNRVAIGL